MISFSPLHDLTQGLLTLSLNGEEIKTYQVTSKIKIKNKKNETLKNFKDTNINYM